VETFEVSQEASVRVAELGRQLGEEWSVDLIRDPEAQREQYLLVVGRFSSEQAAAQARSELQGQVSGSLEVHRRPQ
jgi:hypothetical protein